MVGTPEEGSPEQEDYNDREATELNEYDEDARYHNVVCQTGYGLRADPNATIDARFKSLKAFWKRQISVTVAHEACRDHFGRLIPLSLDIFALVMSLRVASSQQPFR